jgi:hypothetical protein
VSYLLPRTSSSSRNPILDEEIGDGELRFSSLQVWAGDCLASLMSVINIGLGV